jgi:hypothetical protein
MFVNTLLTSAGSYTANLVRSSCTRALIQLHAAAASTDAEQLRALNALPTPTFLSQTNNSEQVPCARVQEPSVIPHS